jgi:hypothetical protein
MEKPQCNLCLPKRLDWQEKGFYGYQCFECTEGKSAFIVSESHKSKLTEEENQIVDELVNKYYPGFQRRRICEKRESDQHWFDFLHINIKQEK